MGNQRYNLLIAWAKDVVAVHRTFLHVFLRASILVPHSQQQASRPGEQCRLPRLLRSDLKLVASYVGVETGRRLRNARELSAVTYPPRWLTTAIGPSDLDDMRYVSQRLTYAF